MKSKRFISIFLIIVSLITLSSCGQINSANKSKSNKVASNKTEVSTAADTLEQSKLEPKKQAADNNTNTKAKSANSSSSVNTNTNSGSGNQQIDTNFYVIELITDPKKGITIHIGTTLKELQDSNCMYGQFEHLGEIYLYEYGEAARLYLAEVNGIIQVVGWDNRRDTYKINTGEKLANAPAFTLR